MLSLYCVVPSYPYGNSQANPNPNPPPLPKCTPTSAASNFTAIPSSPPWGGRGRGRKGDEEFGTRGVGLGGWELEKGAGGRVDGVREEVGRGQGVGGGG